MKSGVVVGVDLGGTKIASASADLKGNLLHRVVMPTMSELGREQVLQNIFASIRAVTEGKGIPLSQVAGIGVVSAGLIDSRSGVILESPNIGGWSDVPLVAAISGEFPAPVSLENDANAAALAEWQWGAGRGMTDMIYITVSTGIGGGLILDGKLYRGAGGTAGEIGHTAIDPHGPVCACGRRGCLEALASGTAIARMARQRMEAGEGTALKAWGKADITAKEVKQGAIQGDPMCLDIFQQAATALGIAIANLANLLNPELVVLGGGVMQPPDLMSDTARAVVAERAFRRPAEILRIQRTRLNQDVALLGAVLLGMEACGLVSLR